MTVIDSKTTAPDLADKIAAKLLEDYEIGWNSSSYEDPSWDRADPVELAATIRKVINAQ